MVVDDCVMLSRVSDLYVCLSVNVVSRCSLLFLSVEPNGPDYEVSLTAQILRPQPTVSALLSNRHFVGFGGLPLGQSTYVF